MRLGIVELVILVVLISGGTWLATTFFSKRGETSSVSLTPDIKAYIDSKTGSGMDCSDLPKLIAKVADLENKLGGAEVLRNNVRAISDRATELEQAVERTRSGSLQLMNQFRQAEVRRIRSEVAASCGGSGGGGGLLGGGSPAYGSGNSRSNPAQTPSILENLPSGGGNDNPAGNSQ